MSEVKNQVEAALKFYADPISYMFTQWDEPRTAVHSDKGRRAKDALAALSHPAPDVPEAEEVEAIRARHETLNNQLSMRATGITVHEGRQVHADRATLLKEHDRQQYAIQIKNSQIEELEELLDAAREELREVREAVSIETKGSLAWWVDRASQHAEDMEEDGFQIDRDHWERIVFAAQTQVARLLTRAQGESS